MWLIKIVRSLKSLTQETRRVVVSRTSLLINYSCSSRQRRRHHKTPSRLLDSEKNEDEIQARLQVPRGKCIYKPLPLWT